MPEAAEVAKVVFDLNSKLAKQDLLNVEIIGGKFLKIGIAGLDKIKFPLRNIKFNAHGKFLYFTFDDETVIFNHLGMSGSFGTRNKHSAIQLSFDKETIFFNDIRHFGNFKFASQEELKNKLKSFGWNVIDPNIPQDMLSRIRKHNHKFIAETLLDQSVFSGSGNWIRNEVCYRVKIHPFTLIKNLTDEQLLILCKALNEIVIEAYEAGGATFSTFKDGNGESGKYASKFKIYRKDEDPFGNPVKTFKDKLGRTIHFVPAVQL